MNHCQSLSDDQAPWILPIVTVHAGMSPADVNQRGCLFIHSDPLHCQFPSQAKQLRRRLSLPFLDSL